MKNFQELLKESQNGNFTVEPTKLIEVSVNWESQTLCIDTYERKDKLSGDFKREVLRAKPSFLGGKSLEELFNEAIKSL